MFDKNTNVMQNCPVVRGPCFGGQSNRPIKVSVPRWILGGFLTLFVLLVCSSTGRGQQTQEQPGNLVLITLDTTRADYVGCYPGARYPELTPRLNALAQNGVLFENALCQIPVTLPSHVSILTGLLPFEHQVLHNARYRIDPAVKTLAGRLKEQGYETAAVVSAFPLDSRFGLDQRFDHYDDCFSPPRGSLGQSRDIYFNERPADRTTQAALRWFTEQRNPAKPFFLWVHYFDPHEPYAPPEPFASKYPQDQYAGEVQFMDREIGHLLDTVWSPDRRRETLVVAVGDHGEALGQHGENSHGIFLYDEVVKVPLILAGSSVQAKRKSLPDQVQTIDIVPTLMTLLDLAPDDTLPGQDLSLYIRTGEKPSARPVYLETHEARFMFGWSSLRALRTGKWKYIDAPSPELYQLEQDPLEEKNLANNHPDKIHQMKTSLQQLVAQRLKYSIGETSIEAPDEETRQKLESLGYLGSGRLVRQRPDQSWQQQSSGRKDPKDFIHLLPEIWRVQSLIGAERYEEALDLCEKILQEDSANSDVRFRQALCLNYLERYSEAETAYQKLVKQFPDDPQCTVGLANLYLGQKQYEKAISLLQETLRRDPYNSDCQFVLAQAFETIGQFESAEKTLTGLLDYDNRQGEVYLERSSIYEALSMWTKAAQDKEIYLQIHPDSAEVWTEIAILYASRLGQKDKFESAMSHALRIDPDYPPALTFLGWINMRLGDTGKAIELLDRALQKDPGYNPAHDLLQQITAEPQKNAENR